MAGLLQGDKSLLRLVHGRAITRRQVTFKVSSWQGYYKETVIFKGGSCGAVTGRRSLLRLVHAGLFQGDSHFRQGCYRQTVTFKVGSCGAITRRQSLLRLVHLGLLWGDSHF